MTDGHERHHFGVSPGVGSLAMAGGLDSAHPLSGLARRTCRVVHPERGVRALVGDTACGACWEQVIRADERVVVEFDLPRELPYADEVVDEIAVERRCRGEKGVSLTRPERAEAVWRLVCQDVPASRIRGLLHVSDLFIQGVITARVTDEQHERYGCEAVADEVGVSTECRYGCKVMVCRGCEDRFVSHRSAYGCSVGERPRRDREVA